MLIVLVVVEPLLPQAIPLRFSEINSGLDSNSSGDDDDYISNDGDTFDADMSEDFDNCMSSQQGQVGKVIDTSTELVDRIEDAFKGLEVDDKMPPLREAHQEFVAALVTYRDTVLHDILARAVGLSGDNSSKMGHSTEWGN
jgi:hypothetical protein